MITDEQVEKYEKIAFKFGKLYLSFPSIREEMEAAIYLGLCEGLKSAERKNYSDPISEIKYCVVNSCMYQLEHSFSIIRLPRSFIIKKQKEAQEKGEEFSFAKLYPEVRAYQDLNYVKFPVYFQSQWRDILYTISEIKLTSIERKVFILILSDYTYAEIAKELNYSNAGIHKIMKRVIKKWLKAVGR